MRSELNEIKTNNDRSYSTNHYGDEHNILHLKTKNNSFKGNKIHSDTENISKPVEPVTPTSHHASTVSAAAEKKTIVDVVKLSTVAVSVVAAATVLPNVTLFPDDLNVSQIVVEQTDTSLWYSAEFSNYDASSDNVIVVLYNDFEKFESESRVEEGQFISGEFMDLRPDMYYTLAIKNNNVTIKSKNVKMNKTVKALNPTVNVFGAPSTISSETFDLNIDISDEQGYDEYMINVLSEAEELKSLTISNTEINGTIPIDMESELDYCNSVSIELVGVKNNEQIVLDSISSIPVMLSKVVYVNVDSDFGKYETFNYSVEIRDDNAKWSWFIIEFYDDEETRYYHDLDGLESSGSVAWYEDNMSMVDPENPENEGDMMQPTFVSEYGGVRIRAFNEREEEEVIYEQDNCFTTYISKLTSVDVPDDMDEENPSITISGHIIDSASRVTNVKLSLWSDQWDELAYKEVTLEEFNSGSVTLSVNSDASLEQVVTATLYIEAEYDYGDGNMGDSGDSGFIRELPSTLYQKEIRIIHGVIISG